MAPQPIRNAWDNFLIALIIWHVCIASTVISTSFQPYRPIQIIHTQPSVLKDQARVHAFKTKEKS